MTGAKIKNILINAVSNFETVDNEYVDAKKLLQTNNLILYDIYIIFIDDKFNVYVEDITKRQNNSISKHISTLDLNIRKTYVHCNFAFRRNFVEEKDGNIIFKSDDNNDIKFFYIGSANDIINDANKHMISSINNVFVYDNYELSSLEISGCIKHIGADVFSDNDNIEYVHFTSDLKCIDSSAFEDCRKLKNIIIENCEHIGNKAFQNCISLESCIFPANLTEIGNEAFSECNRLFQIDMSGTSISSIPIDAFSKCKSLVSAYLPSSLVSIEQGAFRECSNLQCINIENTRISCLQTISFEKCYSLRKVKMPKTLNVIHAGCFSGCSNLIELDLTEMTCFVNPSIDFKLDNLHTDLSILIPVKMYNTYKNNFYDIGEIDYFEKYFYAI